MRLTKKRIMILDILKKESKPLSASNIHQLLNSNQMDLSTVYRTLDRFYDEGIVSKNHIDRTDFYIVNEEEHHHYMMCRKCGSKILFDCHLDALIKEIDKTYHFKVLHHDLNLFGLCKNCQ